MKRWAVVTVLLYFVALVSLTAPVFIDCFCVGAESDMAQAERVFDLYRHGGYWVWIGVALLGQVLLLIVPVGVAEGRPQRRRRLFVPVITAAFLMALVCVSAIGSLAAGLWGDDGLKLFGIFGEDEKAALKAMAVYLLLPWAVWAFVFRRFLTNPDPDAWVRRLMRWLLAGSILELLVAVPSHVIVRHRNDCCAPAVTFWGIATGLTVMLMAYGPGVYFLFVKRMRDLRSKTPAGRPPLGPSP
jgi:hypothetical protein